jgi:EAL domain-containing protein (putative c-di-GMP-specific phosphodiesterase class I)
VLAEARGAPGRPFHLYRPDSVREKRRRKNLELTDDLLTALNDRRLHLALQSVVHAGSRRTAWKEALLRVQLPDGAVISGEPLVRAAEDLGLVGLVDHRVLELALHLLGLRRRARIAINASGSAIIDPSWLDALAARLRRLPDAGRRLQIELDERAAGTDVEATRRFVTRLKAAGVRVTIDGFGAGHLSVTALRDLGAEQVKIDGAFIAGLEGAPERQMAVRALVAFARELGLSVVAGHVESAEAAELLAGWGVGYLQGSFFGAPAVEVPAVRDIAV